MVTTPNVTVPVRVECYAGYRGEETPRRFFLGDQPIEVTEILDRWLAPDHRFFKVKGDDGDRYILRHAARSDSWGLNIVRTGGSRSPSS